MQGQSADQLLISIPYKVTFSSETICVCVRARVCIYMYN
jgi:hypothetical protein